MPDGLDDNVIRLSQARAKSIPDDDLAATEDALALEFSEQHGAALRWCSPWHKWLRWHAGTWQIEQTLWVSNQVRIIARAAAERLNEKRLRRDATIAAIEHLARSDPRHDTKPDAWDVDDEIMSSPEDSPNVD